jgi:hypothetical protein
MQTVAEHRLFEHLAGKFYGAVLEWGGFEHHRVVKVYDHTQDGVLNRLVHEARQTLLEKLAADLGLLEGREIKPDDPTLLERVTFVDGLDRPDWDDEPSLS